MTRRAVVFSVTNVGDLVQATVTFDAIARRVGTNPVVIAAPAGARLLTGDPRLEDVRIVHTSHPITWRVEVMRHVLAARRRAALVVNLELYPPRWRCLRRLCELLGLEAWTLDLPALLRGSRADETRDGGVSHVSAHYGRTVGFPAHGVPPAKVFVQPEAMACMAARLRAAQVDDGRPRIVVHPGSSPQWPAKRAPLSCFYETLQGIVEATRCAIVLVGGENERWLCDGIHDALDGAEGVHNWAGRLTVAELAALLANADVFVGNDSGPLKIAEGVGAKTLSFWGPTSSRFIGPRGPGHVACRFDDPASASVAGALTLLGIGERERRSRAPV